MGQRKETTFLAFINGSDLHNHNGIVDAVASCSYSSALY